MKKTLATLLTDALKRLIQEGTLPEIEITEPQISRTKDTTHGDWASNVALTLAKVAKMPPRAIAENITSKIAEHPAVTHIEIAGPGFINFFVSADSQHQVIPTILSKQAHFGLSTSGQGRSVQIEYVSANPTGPLHVGHGRGAAYGASLANVLEAAGYHVDREYYVNDAGRQMNILAVSVWLRYLSLYDITPLSFPEKIYQGRYVIDIAEQAKTEFNKLFCRDAQQIHATLEAEQSNETPLEDEALTDALIKTAQTLLGDTYNDLFNIGLNTILKDIRDDLVEFNVNYACWFSEKSIQDNIPGVIDQLEANGHIYEKEGAKWFRSTTFGDDKDRVVIRENGQSTYFASDIAYHFHKYTQGYDHIINIWGADHHGYVLRVKAALEALGLDPNKLSILLVQFAILYRGKERVQMSTRSGSFVTLRELRGEVGNDAARFFYVLRKAEQHMDFDLELAKSQSKDNPVYYIQYAHARICSVFEKLNERALTYEQDAGLSALSELKTDHELSLINKLSEYPEVIEKAAKHFEPHSVATYLRELASDFHTYYNAHIVLTEESALRNARLTLSLAAKHVLSNGLTLLGVSAPERM